MDIALVCLKYFYNNTTTLFTVVLVEKDALHRISILFCMVEFALLCTAATWKRDKYEGPMPALKSISGTRFSSRQTSVARLFEGPKRKGVFPLATAHLECSENKEDDH